MRKQKRACLVVAHGSKDPEMVEEFSALLKDFDEGLPGTSVSGAFLEILKPTVGESIDAIIGSGVHVILIFPLILFSGKHYQQQLPEILANKKMEYPEADFHLAPPLLHLAGVREALSLFLRQS